MRTEPITATEALALLDQARDTQPPGFIYRDRGNDYDPRCFYQPQPDDFPSTDPRHYTGCLVGVALTLGGEERHIGFGGTVTLLAEACPDMFADKLTVDIFAAAQRAQDRGETWDYAVQEAYGTYHYRETGVRPSVAW